MYRALKGFYLISACLSYEERRKIVNVFTLTLGPHGANIKTVIEVFDKAIRQLNKDMKMIINEESKQVCAFSMIFLGDMSQQTNNEGFLRHNVNRGCRTCLCSKLEKGDLTYDIVGNDRYHWETTRQRELVKDLSRKERNAFETKKGIKLDAPPLAKLAPCLDLILSRAYDASHSEWQGIERILQSFLMTAVLNKKGGVSYLKAFQTIRYPPEWPRIQSPRFYIWSWSLSKAGRASVLISLILRKYASITWFRFTYLQAAAKVFDRDITTVRAITKAFDLIAYANTLVGSQRYTYHARLHQIILERRQAYQNLIACAMQSAEASRRDTNTGAEEVGEAREDDDE